MFKKKMHRHIIQQLVNSIIQLNRSTKKSKFAREEIFEILKIKGLYI